MTKRTARNIERGRVLPGAHDLLLALGSGILLILSFPKFGAGIFAWIGLIPLFYALRNKNPGQGLLLGLAAGLTAHIGIMYWIVYVVVNYGYLPYPVGVAAMLLLASYLSVYTGLFAAAVAFFQQRRTPLWLVAPVIWVVLEYGKAHLLTGFPWENLGYSQYRYLPLIQIADLFGTFGISALIAAVNGVAAEAVLAIGHRRIFSKRLWLSAALTGALIGASILYGNYQLKEIDANRQISSNCSAASVQTNVPTAVKEETDNAGAILDNLFVLSDQCIQAGAKLIVWPETMVLTSLNPGYREYFLDKP